jgi:glycosyltransferase involved in cell wall biosynthesis
MKALFYSPYLDSLGGGERYVLTLVEALNRVGWKTSLLWDGKSVTEDVKRKFGIDIGNTEYVSGNKIEHLSENLVLKLASKYKFLRSYDLVFWLSDGSLPWLFGRKNIIHFQSPFVDVYGRGWLNRLKERLVNNFVVNSEFTKGFVDGEYGIVSKVIYPPVAVEEIKPDVKEDVILYTARFSNLMQQKGHELMIRAFKELCDTGVRSYKLWLAGSTEVGVGELLENLKVAARGYPVEFFYDLSWEELLSLYGRARFFWSAVGYEADELREPEKCEHFGISLVEAMAGGCVPLVVNRGGYKEIVDSGKNGWLWNSWDEWLGITTRLMNDRVQAEKVGREAVRRSKDFSIEVFVKKFMEII